MILYLMVITIYDDWYDDDIDYAGFLFNTNKCLPILYSKWQYKMGHHFLDIQ